MECSLDQELEIVGRRLPQIESTFAEGWDTECDRVPGRGPEWRAVVALMDSGALVAILARESPTDPEVVEIRNLTVIPPP